MNLKIYQSFFKPEQYALLDKAFIPYENLENKMPWQREYPLILDLYEKNKSYVGYWGLMSCKFSMKTGISGEQFKSLIRNNPGYDVYHFNPYPQVYREFINPFTQGDFYHHVGIADYTNKLMHTLGYADFNIRNERFATEHFVFCSYYIGNSSFWNRWIVFLTTCVHVSRNNPELNAYLINSNSIHDNVIGVPNFPFVIERLVGLFLHLSADVFKTKCFTFE